MSVRRDNSRYIPLINPITYIHQTDNTNTHTHTHTHESFFLKTEAGLGLIAMLLC